MENKMARQEIEIPVYIFMGFLDSGKTTFVKETLLDREFTGGAKTLLLVCEEGEEEYDEKDKSYTIIGIGNAFRLFPAKDYIGPATDDCHGQ